MRLFFQLVFQLAIAVLASAGAVVSYQIWTAAAANSASPGAIVILGIAVFCALMALIGWLAVAIGLARYLWGGAREPG